MYVKDVEDGKRTYTYIHIPLFNLEKSFGKLCILKHVEDVKDRSSTLKERL